MSRVSGQDASPSNRIRGRVARHRRRLVVCSQSLARSYLASDTITSIFMTSPLMGSVADAYCID
jgi:hypothetical protein